MIEQTSGKAPIPKDPGVRHDQLGPDKETLVIRGQGHRVSQISNTKIENPFHFSNCCGHK